jgi:NAD(P)-dependent dehydrogenase (short-subunit alcohol dehydrogenase family)
VTGANRGIGRALVEEALRRGAKRVYAGARQPLAHRDPRVTPLTLDVTNAGQIQAAVESVESLDIVINNAGLGLYVDLSDRAALEQSLAVNLFGPYDVTQAFLPLLSESRGAIVNVVSLAAWAAVPVMPAYSISKAAAFSLSQALRALLAGRGVSVHAAMLGPVDTDMTRSLAIPKSSPASVARGIFAGVEDGEEEIFPDPMSEPTGRAGAAVRPRRSSARTPRSYRQSRSRLERRQGRGAASSRSGTPRRRRRVLRRHHDGWDKRDGSRTDGDAGACRRLLDRRDPPDKRNCSRRQAGSDGFRRLLGSQ